MVSINTVYVLCDSCIVSSVKKTAMQPAVVLPLLHPAACGTMRATHEKSTLFPTGILFSVSSVPNSFSRNTALVLVRRNVEDFCSPCKLQFFCNELRQQSCWKFAQIPFFFFYSSYSFIIALCDANTF